MLSICIPVFNFLVEPLVASLDQQATALGLTYEILCVDDQSDDAFKKLNRRMNFSGLHYEELTVNQGRAKIRNTLARKAKYDFLLFLDCDVNIDHQEFLSRYLQALHSDADVICGGHTYPSKRPSIKNRLKWKYGSKREVKTASQRNAVPYQSFMTANFVIKKQLLLDEPFDESLSVYGHEDTMMGIRLQQRGAHIQHIDNPVLIGDIESNQAFLKKTKSAVANLCSLYKRNPQEIATSTRLMKYFKKLESLQVLPLANALFWLAETAMYWLLCNGFNSLVLLDFYKLGILVQEISKGSTGNKN